MFSPLGHDFEKPAHRAGRASSEIENPPRHRTTGFRNKKNHYFNNVSRLFGALPPPATFFFFLFLFLGLAPKRGLSDHLYTTYQQLPSSFSCILYVFCTHTHTHTPFETAVISAASNYDDLMHTNGFL